MNAQTVTARIPENTRNKLLVLSRFKNRTMSDIIKESLDRYYENEEKEMDSFSLGAGFFGNYGSRDGDRSTAYKQRIKEKLHGKSRSY
jgi:predicted DNA-binding protein